MPFTGITVPVLPAVGLGLGAALPGPLHPGLQAALLGGAGHRLLSLTCVLGGGLWCPGTLQISCPGCVVDTVLVALVSFGEAAARAKCARAKCEED